MSKAVRASLLAWVSVIVALAAGLAGVAWLSTALYAAAILCGAFYFAREAVEELVSEREVGIELLMTAAIAGAISVALVAALYSISEARITDSWTALAEGSELGVQSRHRKHLRESRTAGSPRSPTRRGRRRLILVVDAPVGSLVRLTEALSRTRANELLVAGCRGGI